MVKGIAPPSQFPAGVKIRIGCLNLPLSGTQKWAEVLHHSSILGGPQTNGDTIRIGCLTLPYGGPTSGRKCYVNPGFSGIPDKEDKSKEIRKKSRKKTISHVVLDPACCHADSSHFGLSPGPFSCRGTAFPLGYGSSLTHLCTGVVIFGPIWFSSIIGFSSRN